MRLVNIKLRKSKMLWGNETRTHTVLSFLMSSLSDKHSWKEEEEEEVVATVGSGEFPC